VPPVQLFESQSESMTQPQPANVHSHMPSVQLSEQQSESMTHAEP
jgi:hypothetical protein